MNLPTPSTPPTVKGMINAAGKETANIGQGIRNVATTISRNVNQGQASPNAQRANYSINPIKGTGKAFMSAFKKSAKPKRAK